MDNKKQALDAALAMIDKQFGKWAVMKLWDQWKIKVETVSSWSIALDDALGWWYAKWRIVEIYGPESSWKTTLTLHAIAECQKAGWTAAFIDAEHALDPSYAEKIWVDTSNLIISQPDCWEQALEIVDALVRSWAVDLIVVDSVAALTPRAEIEGSMWDSHMWLQARLMSQALRKLTSQISKTNTSVIFINQIRMKIWVMFWSPETTTWWNALKFYATQRLDIRRKWKIENWTWNDKTMTWNLTKVKVVKNKIAPPFREVEFDIMYNEWISKVWEILLIWTDKEIIKKSWAFYSYWDIKLGQWKEKAKQFLKDNPDIADEIELKIRTSFETDEENKENNTSKSLNKKDK